MLTTGQCGHRDTEATGTCGGRQGVESQGQPGTSVDTEEAEKDKCP